MAELTVTSTVALTAGRMVELKAMQTVALTAGSLVDRRVLMKEYKTVA
jgi:hypothetical protein